MEYVSLTSKILKELTESVNYVQYEKDGVKIILENSYVNFSPETRYLLKELNFQFINPFLIKGPLFSAFYAFPYHVKPYNIKEFWELNHRLKDLFSEELSHLYEFQRDTAMKAFLNYFKREMDYFGLFWDVGVGKTVTSLTIARKIQESKKVPVLVLAPKALLVQWKDEALKFNLFDDIAILGKNREFQYENPSKLMLTTYEAFRIDYEKYSDVWDDYIVILDEASKIKNYSAKITRTVIKAFKNSVYKMALTATPYETNPNNVYNILRFLNPYLIPKDLFLRAFSHNPNLKKIKLKNPVMLRQFMNLIGDFKRKEEVKELPKLMIKDVVVSLTKVQEKAASLLAQNTKHYLAIHNLLKINDNSYEDLKSSTAPLVEALREEFSQLYYKKHTEKDEVLLSFLEEIYPRQVLIFTQYKRTAYRLSQTLSNYSHKVVTGSTQDKFSIIEEFKQGSLPILIATDTLAYGISFPDVNYLINYDILYNPAKMHQRIGRIYRITSQYPKYVLNIIGGGIEKKAYEVLTQRTGDMFSLIASQQHVNEKDILVNALSSYLSGLLGRDEEEIRREILEMV